MQAPTHDSYSGKGGTAENRAVFTLMEEWNKEAMAAWTEQDLIGSVDTEPNTGTQEISGGDHSLGLDKALY